MPIFLYVLMALIVGWLGRNKSIGFVGYFLLSLALTPLLMFFILLIGYEKRPFERN